MNRYQNLQRLKEICKSGVINIFIWIISKTGEGKQLLQRDLTDAINQVLRDKEGFGGIDNVYFSNLVIQ